MEVSQIIYCQKWICLEYLKCSTTNHRVEQAVFHFLRRKTKCSLAKCKTFSVKILFNVISPRYHFLLPEPLAESKDGTMCSFFSSSTDAQVTSLRSHRVCLFSVSVNCLFFLVRKDYAFMYDVILLKFCNPKTNTSFIYLCQHLRIFHSSKVKDKPEFEQKPFSKT